MADYLSDEWMTRYAELGAELPERAGINMITQYVVEKTPNGNIRWFDVVADGRVTEAALGKHKEADVKITWKYPYDRKMLSGELRPDAAYMQGRIKVEGDHPKWLFSWSDVLHSPEYQDFQASVHAETDYPD